MPHCVIEYSNDLEKNNDMFNMVQMVNQKLIDSELFDNKTIKTRAIPVSKYLIGGEISPFIHTTIRLLEGRTEKTKEQLSNNVLNLLSEKYKLVKNISVEVIDINKKFYSKN